MISSKMEVCFEGSWFVHFDAVAVVSRPWIVEVQEL